MQPIAGNKFGTQNAVEYFSERYQQLLNIRFYGLLISRLLIQFFSMLALSANKIEDHKPFTIQDIAQGTLRQNISPKIAIAIAKYTNENGVDIYSLNANQDTFNEVAKQEVNKVWTGLYGIMGKDFLHSSLHLKAENVS